MHIMHCILEVDIWFNDYTNTPYTINSRERPVIEGTFIAEMIHTM